MSDVAFLPQVEQGTISVGDKLWVMPNRVAVEVLNLWLDQEEVRGNKLNICCRPSRADPRLLDRR